MFKKKKKPATQDTNAPKNKELPEMTTPEDKQQPDLNAIPEREPTMPVKNPVVRPSDYVFHATRRKPERGGENKKLIVGHEIKLTGEIASCDNLMVEGEVEADLPNAFKLEIAEGGRFKGNATVETADISGEFEGTLVVNDFLILRKTGYIKGTVHYKEVQIERGGEMSGSMEKVTGEKKPAQQPLSFGNYDEPL